MKTSTFLFTIFATCALASSTYAQFTPIYTFSGAPDGLGPSGTPLIGTGGVLYATTAQGGTGSCLNGCGTVFSLAPPVPPATSWTESVLYSFQGTPDGAYPQAGVISGPGGILLGTAGEGGTTVNPRCPSGCGALFQLSPPGGQGGPWISQILFSFPVPDSNLPRGLVMAPNGELYGAAFYGGSQGCQSLGCGSIYELNPPSAVDAFWTETQVHEFSSGLGGQWPNSPLVLASTGTLYGSFSSAGPDNNGGIFSLTPPQTSGSQWSFARLYGFKSAKGGMDPAAGLVEGPNGVLYGTTISAGPGCGSNGCSGIVFSLTPPAQVGDTWKYTGIHVFTGGSNDGAFPQSNGTNLAVAGDGTIYGVTPFGGGTGCGGDGCGVLFMLTPPVVGGGTWTETILHIFTGGSDGLEPQFAPVIGSNGTLYGVTDGGAGTACFGGGCGVVYQYVP